MSTALTLRTFARAMKLLASGIQGDVYVVPGDTGVPSYGGLVVIKVVHAPSSGDDPRLRPHNAAREARLLACLQHQNIVRLLDYKYEHAAHRLTLELLPLPLPDFIAGLADEPDAPDDTQDAFMLVARGLFAALAYLHARGIAHRDVKPANILLSADGVPKLVDFATAWEPPQTDGDEEMVCAVGTGPYRAPELLFGPHAYDARALDLWAAGAALAEFYPRASPAETPSTDGSDSDCSSPISDGDSVAEPSSLFDARFGELGLAGSIFGVLGTPTTASWPTFTALPDAGKIEFEARPARSIGEVLDAPGGVVRVLEAVLRLDPGRRAGAEEVLRIVGEVLRIVGEASQAKERAVLERIQVLAARRMGGLQRLLEGEAIPPDNY